MNTKWRQQVEKLVDRKEELASYDAGGNRPRTSLSQTGDDLSGLIGGIFTS